MKTLLFVAAALGMPGVAYATPTPPRQPRVTTTCDFAGDAWIKDAATYIHNGKVSPGKRPAIWATISLISVEPANTLAGKTADRTVTWYCFGEVTAETLPSGAFLKGTLPLWSNTGPDDAPFGASTNQTLILATQNTGQTTFQYQIDGRNRMGKGPQSIPVSVVASGTKDKTLMLSSSTNFFGSKIITIAFTKGEADK